jgi:hypothetical protein
LKQQQLLSMQQQWHFFTRMFGPLIYRFQSKISRFALEPLVVVMTKNMKSQLQLLQRILGWLDIPLSDFTG